MSDSSIVNLTELQSLKNVSKANATQVLAALARSVQSHGTAWVHFIGPGKAEPIAWITDGQPRSEEDTEVPVWLRHAWHKEIESGDTPLDGKAWLGAAGTPLQGGFLAVPLGDDLLMFWWRGANQQSMRFKQLQAVACTQAVRAKQATIEQAQAKQALHAHDLAEKALAALYASHDVRHASFALCGVLAHDIDATRVSLGMCHSGGVRLLALSHTSKFKRATPMVIAMEEAMAECADQARPVLAPTPKMAPVVSRLATAYLKEHGDETFVLLPLQGVTRKKGDEMPVVGVLGLELDWTDEARLADVLRACGKVMKLCGPRLQYLNEQARSPLVRGWFATKRAAYSLVGPRYAAWKLAGLGCILLVILGMVVKVENVVRAPFVVQAQEKYHACAHYDATLQEVFVQLDSHVVAGDPLFALDSKVLQAERENLQAQAEEQRLRGEMARQQGKASEAAIYFASAEGLQAKMGAIDLQLAQTLVRAPYDAVVLSWGDHADQADLPSRVGAPVQRGETLLVLVSLDQVDAVLDIPVHRFEDVQQALDSASELPVDLASQGNPDVTWQTQLGDIGHVVRSAEGTSYIQARLSDLPVEDWSYPGMEGMSRIRVGEKAVGWILIRDSVNWVRMQMWSWGL